MVHSKGLQATEAALQEVVHKTSMNYSVSLAALY